MLMPNTQEKRCVSVLSETHEVTSEQSAHFHSWSIAGLPAELLLQITSHLSFMDACNLALVSRRVYSVLEEYGLFKVVRHFGSLKKNEQLFYRNLSIANPQLIHHLRTSKIQVIAGQSHLTENLPAICAYHACRLRNKTIHASSINFELKKKIGMECHISDYYLNKNQSRLIIKDCHNCQLSIWTAGKNGSWNRELSIDRKSHRCLDKFDCSSSIDRYHGNTLFIPVDPPPSDGFYTTYSGKDALLSIVERNESGVWFETQRMTFDNIYPDFSGDHSAFLNSYSVDISPNGQSVIYSNNVAHDAILGRESDVQWALKGHYSRCGSKHFSRDSNHIAIMYDNSVKFLGKQKNGRWLVTGKLQLELLPRLCGVGEYSCFDNMTFSPDSRHFSACFNDTLEECFYSPVEAVEFYVTIASLDDNGRWSETTRIIKQATSLFTSLDATFSPDSRYLVVCGESNFDIWRLMDDKCWTPVIKDHSYFQTEDHCLPESTVQFNTGSSVFMLLREGAAMVWQLNGAGIWDCQLQFTYTKKTQDLTLSPDGNSIICADGSGRLGFWGKNQNGEWTRQTPDLDLRMRGPEFNADGSLLAGRDVDNLRCLIVLGVTQNGTWQEKSRLQLEGCIRNFNFSPCGRFIQIDSLDRKGKILTFLEIVHEPDRNQSVLGGF